jgi:hypothetical protein
MLYPVHHHRAGLAKQAKLLPARARAWWLAGVTLVSMLALVVMLFAAVSHQHASGAPDEDDCIICNLAFDALDHVPNIPAVVEIPTSATFYYLLVSMPTTLVDVFRSISPPGCGPPSLLA